MDFRSHSGNLYAISSRLKLKIINLHFDSTETNCTNCLFFRSDVLKKNIPRIEGRPGEQMPPLDFLEFEEKLKKTHGPNINECDIMSAVMYPKVAADFFKFREKYGPVVSMQVAKINIHSP